MASYVTSKTYANPWPQKGEPEYSETEEPAAALASATAYWANPLLSSESAQCIADLRAVLPGGHEQDEVGAEPLPGDAPERAADADRHLPRHAGELSIPENDFENEEI